MSSLSWSRLAAIARGRGTFLLSVLIMSAGLAAIALRLSSPPPDHGVDLKDAPLRVALAEATEDWTARPIEGRLAGGFSHAPFDSKAVIRLTALSSEKASTILAAEAAYSSSGDPTYRVARDSGSPERISRDRAHAILLQGRASEAVAALEISAALAPGDPEVATDLAAALLDRAAREGRPADLVRALGEAERAIALAPAMPEPAFNRALALHALYLTAASSQAWKSYLTLDSSSAWAGEALQHVRRLGTRDRESLGAPRPDPNSGTDPPRRKGGWIALRRGIELYEEQRIDEAHARLLEAEALLSRGDAYALLEARFYIALCYYQKADYDSAMELLPQIARLASGSADPSMLEGRSLQLIGMIHHIRGHRGEALTAYLLASEVLLAVGETNRWAGVQVVLAQLFDQLGRKDLAWHHRYLALSEGPNLDPYGRSRLYGESASALLRDGDLVAARYFLDALLEAAEASQNMTAVSSAFRRRAIRYYREGALQQAMEDFEQAELWAQRIPDLKTAAISQAEVLIARGEASAALTPRNALRDLQSAKALLQGVEDEGRSPSILLVEAKAHRALGEILHARLDLEAAMKGVESQLSELGATTSPGGFFGEVARPVFDESIDLGLRMGDEPGAVLRLAERALGGANVELLPRAQDGPHGVLERSSLPRYLDPGVSMILYYFLGDRLLVWAVDHSGIAMREVPTTQQRVSAMIRGLEAAVVAGGRSDDISLLASELFELLITPVIQKIGLGKDLLFVPDGVLQGLPFGLLRNVATGRYLIEDNTITVLASPGRALQSGQGRDRSASLEGSGVLVLAEPTFDRAMPGQAPLPGSMNEARAIASRFPNTIVLSGVRATPQAFLDEARGRGILHLATHAVSNPNNPRLSYIVLSPGEQDSEDGLLYVEDLEQGDFTSTRLVVVAACNSSQDYGRQAGITSLARGFQAVGVDQVIGSLWPVEDRPASELFSLFYGYLSRGRAVEHALRSAQLDLLLSGDPVLSIPSAWAGYQVQRAGR